MAKIFYFLDPRKIFLSKNKSYFIHEGLRVTHACIAKNLESCFTSKIPLYLNILNKGIDQIYSLKLFLVKIAQPKM